MSLPERTYRRGGDLYSPEQRGAQQKESRGELPLGIPAGYVVIDNRHLRKHADARVQRVINSVFEKFASCVSVNQLFDQLRGVNDLHPRIMSGSHGEQVEWSPVAYRSLWSQEANRSFARILNPASVSANSIAASPGGIRFGKYLDGTIFVAFLLILNPAMFADNTNDQILIHNRLQLSAQPSPCHRIALGEPDDYKPCIARLPGGELLLTAFHPHKRDGNTVMEQTLLFRSKDGGKSTSDQRPADSGGERSGRPLHLVFVIRWCEDV